MKLFTRQFACLIAFATFWLFMSVASVLANGNITEAALKGDWPQVYEEALKYNDKTAGPVKDLLLGYASLYCKDWNESWRHFSAIDKSRQQESLLSWSEEVCKANPKSAMAFVFKGDTLARLDRYNDAIASLDRAVELDATMALAYDLRGLVKLMAGALQEAAGNLEKALEINPKMYNALYERGLVALMGGDFEGAVSYLTGVLNDEPKFFLARNARGVAHLLQAKYDLAFQDFDQVAHDNPDFVDARTNKTLAALLRAKGLFAVDMKKLSALSPKGILGAKAITNFYYAGAGINSPHGGQTLEIAKQRAGTNARVVWIREKDYIAQGMRADDPRLVATISTLISMETRSAKAQGKNIVVSVIPNLENYKTQLASEYMFGAKQWKESKRFCSTVMDAAINGYGQVEKNGTAVADIHSFHGEAFSITKGKCFDQVNAIKIRTGAGLNDNFANRCRKYVENGKSVNLFTGHGDIPSLWNTATKSSAVKLADKGLVTSYYDKLNHGHGVPLGKSLFEVRTRTGKSTVVGTLNELTGSNICRNFCNAQSRSGVFMKLGSTDMDVKKVNKTDLSFLHGDKQVSLCLAQAFEGEPDLSYPFLIFNP